MNGIALRALDIAPPVNGSPCQAFIAGATRPTSTRFSGIKLTTRAARNQLMTLGEFAA